MVVEAAILAVFFVVYLGMILGGLPFLQLDRTGVALLGAIVLVSVGALTLEEAWGAIHAPTLILLFAFMVISAQLRLGGFYNWVTWRLGAVPLPPAGLLAALIAAIAALSAVFSNDIICLAVAPVLVDVCLARRLNPVPFLLALACAANVGSAATLIGNPQNMLIGETLKLPFLGYIREVALPVALVVRPGDVARPRPVAGLAADVDVGPGGGVTVGLLVVVLAQVGRVAVGALVVPVLVDAGPVQRIAGLQLLIGIEVEPALPALVLRP